MLFYNYITLTSQGWPRQLSRYSDSLLAGRSADRIPIGGEIFRTRPDRPWGPPSLLYNAYRISFPGIKRPGRGVDHPQPSSAEVKENVQLYLFSPSGPSWPVLG
jgi:hypothetical protein